MRLALALVRLALAAMDGESAYGSHFYFRVSPPPLAAAAGVRAAVGGVLGNLDGLKV